MSTYGQMQTRIADELIRPDLSSQIQNAIQDAIKVYEDQRFYFNELYRQTATVTAGSYFIPLPANVLKIDKLVLQANSSVEDYLTARDAQLIIECQTPLFTSQPTQYAIYGEKILFDCQSDQTYPLYISGTQKFTAPSASGDTNAWFTDAEELIRHRAKYNVYMDVIMDPDNAAICAQREKQALSALLSKSVIRGSGRVRPTQF